MAQLSPTHAMKEHYNILFIFPLPFHPERGGVERVTDLLARELSARGHRIFYLHRPGKPGKEVSYGDYEPPASVHFLPQRKLRSAKNIAFYHRFLEENRIDFIVNQMGVSRNYCHFTSVPKREDGYPISISVLHSNPLMNYAHMGVRKTWPARRESPVSALSQAFTPIRKWFYKLKRVRELREVAQSSDCMCTLSPAYGDMLRGLGVPGKADCRLRAIANPCSFPPLQAVPAKRRQLLYVGRLESALKCPQRLIPIWRRLCKQHPDWELVIVGDGPCRQPLEADMADLPRVRFEGYCSPAPWYRDAAICCLTSSVEGFPMVLLEAMSHGAVPVAYNSFPVLSELLGGHMEQLAASPFNPEDFANKLSWLMSHEEERLQLAEDCLATSRKYTLDAIINRWESLLAELAAGR